MLSGQGMALRTYINPRSLATGQDAFSLRPLRWEQAQSASSVHVQRDPATQLEPAISRQQAAEDRRPATRATCDPTADCLQRSPSKGHASPPTWSLCLEIIEPLAKPSPSPGSLTTRLPVSGCSVANHAPTAPSRTNADQPPIGVSPQLATTLPLEPACPANPPCYKASLGYKEHTVLGHSPW